MVVEPVGPGGRREAVGQGADPHVSVGRNTPQHCSVLSSARLQLFQESASYTLHLAGGVTHAAHHPRRVRSRSASGKMGSSMRGHPGKRHLAIAFGARALHLLAKALEIGASQLLPLDLRLAEWIDRLAAALNLEVQMLTGRAAGVADEADQFALADARAFLNAGRETREMPV